MATTYGKPYYRFSNSLKILNLTFDSILPKDIPNYWGHLVLTTRKEAPFECKKPMLHEEIFEQHPTVIRGLMIQKLDLGFDQEELVIGIDPGQRIGLSIFYFGREIESSFHSSVDNVVMHIIRVLGGLRAKRKIVKIGDGNMNVAKQIGNLLNLKFCSSFELEFVDERKTSPKIKNFNQRGKRDMLSAKYISQRDGYRHSILPLSITG
ncbi:hypothetical protein NsoK4_00270 [Nitrosopumilus sp. K4]|nr:hypothetical protein NsoK4_00270 [Nitrosopumilus sp. K4]